MFDMEPARFAVTEICRARCWKFWEEMYLRLVSDSGFGVPVHCAGEVMQKHDLK